MSQRRLDRPELPPGPLRELKELLFDLYEAAGCPATDVIAGWLKKDDDLPGSPSGDTVLRCLTGLSRPTKVQDVVSIATVLARTAGRDEQGVQDAVASARRWWQQAPSTSKTSPARPGSGPVGCRVVGVPVREAVWQRQPHAEQQRRTPDPLSASRRLGRPVDKCDPLALEVHRAIQVPGAGAPGDVLPRYMPRAHDTLLREIADRLLGDGSSRLVTLVGGSSTGKTRACWELARHLDAAQPGRWRVWHPYDPPGPQAALTDLQRVGGYTVVWLNEAQHYLMTANPALDEQLAAGLRTLLQDPGRGPLLVLATLWPQFWDALTVRPDARQPDPYAQARELLTGTMVSVADTFTPEQVVGLAAPGADARLRFAAEHAEDGRITQYLAGAPELEDRYRAPGSPAARALIQIAMDARRLGHPPAIPHAILEQAAPGYLNDHDWNALSEDWLEQALADTARDCKGAGGPLTRIRSRPDRPTPDSGPYYRLADYLEQIGRTERAGVYPPDSLWRAFSATLTDSGLLRHLGEQAEQRGRCQHAIWLYTPAADRGDTAALRALAWLKKRTLDIVGAIAILQQAANLGDTGALLELAQMREEVGDALGAENLYRRAADLGDTAALKELGKLRIASGNLKGAEALYLRAAELGDTSALKSALFHRNQAGDVAGAHTLAAGATEPGDALSFLAFLRWDAGDFEGAEALYLQVANLGDTFALRQLAKIRERVGDAIGAENLYLRAAELGDTHALSELGELRIASGDLKGAEALYLQAADNGTVMDVMFFVGVPARASKVVYQRFADHGNKLALVPLARWREQAEDVAGAEALWRQLANDGSAQAWCELVRLREQAKDATGAESLAIEGADRGKTRALRELAEQREQAGDIVGAEALWRQAIDRGDSVAFRDLVRLLHQTGAQGRLLQMNGMTASGEGAGYLDFGPYDDLDIDLDFGMPEPGFTGEWGSEVRTGKRGCALTWDDVSC